MFATGPFLEGTEGRWWMIDGKSGSTLASSSLWLIVPESVFFSLTNVLFANFCAPGGQERASPPLGFPPRRGWVRWVIGWPHSSGSLDLGTQASILQPDATASCCHDSLGMPWSFLVHVEILFAWNKKAASLGQAAFYVRRHTVVEFDGIETYITCFFWICGWSILGQVF